MIALLSKSQVVLEYRFLLGNPSLFGHSPSVKYTTLIESYLIGDMLFVDSPDDYPNLSRKVFEGFQWQGQYSFDYLIKTDDDMFVRLDQILAEIKEVASKKKQRTGYWKGLVYRDMPKLEVSWNKNADENYELPIYPVFTAGALYILSSDLIYRFISMGTTHNSNRDPVLFTKNEDQNLGIWLVPLNVNPIHDRRIQQWHVCEEDMIAKHFFRDFKDSDMRLIYKNVLLGRPLCKGFRTDVCALCYDCEGKSTDWIDWGYECRQETGITWDYEKSPYFTEAKDPEEAKNVDQPGQL